MVMYIFVFQRDHSIQKLEDVTNTVQKTLSDLCMCNITSDNIDDEFFTCFDPSSLYVTYRARLSCVPDSHILVSYIEDWVSGGASVLVQGVQIRLDTVCPVSITSFGDGECSESPTPATSQSSSDNTSTTRSTTDNTASTTTDNTAAIIGGVVVAIVLIIAVLVFGMTVLILVWKSRHGNQKTEE